METNPFEMAPDQSAAMKARIRGTAVCAALAGAFLTTYSVFTSFLPPGLPDGPYRDPGMLNGMFFLPGVLLTVGAAVGIYFLHQIEGTAAKAVRIAALTAAASFFFGIALLPAAWYVGSVLVYLAILAFAVTGIGLLQAQTLPAWSGGLLAVTSLLLLGFNTEDSRVLFLVPFGLAWILLAVLLFAGRFAKVTLQKATVQESGPEDSGGGNVRVSKSSGTSRIRRHYATRVFHAHR